MKAAIPFCIGLLLFTAVLRIFADAQLSSVTGFRKSSLSLTGRVLLSQLALPCLLLLVGSLLALPPIWLLAMTLVAAAPPISGCPNLVLLMRGDAALALRWLMLGTALLPLTCIPVLFFLYPEQPLTAMLKPSLMLLLLIAVSVGLALIVILIARRSDRVMNQSALDGFSALVLAVMVIGLMSAFHHPETSAVDVLSMLTLAFAVNIGLQLVGVLMARVMNYGRSRAICSGVVCGNRNIALYLTALPAVQLEPLLLFIACYQVPMYLTPLMGDYFYRRLEFKSHARTR